MNVNVREIALAKVGIVQNTLVQHSVKSHSWQNVDVRGGSNVTID